MGTPVASPVRGEQRVQEWIVPRRRPYCRRAEFVVVANAWRAQTRLGSCIGGVKHVLSTPLPTRTTSETAFARDERTREDGRKLALLDDDD